MKKISFFICLFFAGVALAQESIVLPSSFDENQMIVKKMDSNGNYIPIEQPDFVQGKTLPENTPPSVKERNHRPQGQVGQMKFDNQSKQRPVGKLPLKTQKELKNSNVQEQTIPTVESSTPRKRLRKFRAVEKDYSIPKTTFGNETLQKIEVPEQTTFQMPTMEKAVRDFRRESISFEECDTEDPNCKVYELDEAGRVIFK